LQVAREYKERGIPVSAIVIDYFHWTEQGDFKFDPQFWPDPAGMVKELEETLIYMQGQSDLLEGGAKKARSELAAAAAELEEKKALIQEDAQEGSQPETLADAKLELQKVQDKAFVFDGDTEICRLEAVLEPLYAKHKAIFKYLHEVCTGQKCALCGHEMEDADVMAAREELKRNLEECISEGRAAKAELKRLTQEKEKAFPSGAGGGNRKAEKEHCGTGNTVPDGRPAEGMRGAGNKNPYAQGNTGTA
jgi:hypothetical protein